MTDLFHKKINYKASEIEHKYGKQVHILSDPYLLTQLATLCSKDTYQPLITEFIQSIYRHILRYVANVEFSRCVKKIETRMIVHNPEGVLEAEIIDPNSKVVVVNLARAGAIPALESYQQLNYLLKPQNVRQDHIYIQRSTNEQQSVVGAHVSGYKIGGPVKDSIIYVPDPMGATGSTLEAAYELYKSSVEGPWEKFISAHLIVTPEFLRHITKKCPEIIIYAVRIDRGLSDSEVLQTIPGTNWDKERGLNEKQYIVPGAGGLGEILNNSFV